MGYVLKNTKHRITVNSAAKPFVSAQIKPGESSLEVMKAMLNLFKESSEQAKK